MNATGVSSEPGPSGVVNASGSSGAQDALRALLQAQSDLATGHHAAQVHLAQEQHSHYATYLAAATKAFNDAAARLREAQKSAVEACSDLSSDGARTIQQAQQNYVQSVRELQESLGQAEQEARKSYLEALRKSSADFHRSLRSVVENYGNAVSAAADPRELATADPQALQTFAIGLISAAHALALVPPAPTD